jgi:outer membrane receptor protein involved in Fe transport
LKLNHKITCAVVAALGAHSGATYAADADTSATAAPTGVEEVIVTAQRRNESAQDVPITIQAITGEQLSQLNVTTFEDVMKYLPNVTFASPNPGSGNIYMRGLAAGRNGDESSATIAPFPNVATYLDDQSMSFPSRNVDVYYADMDRVEVLEGPQGTLFGGGAEAGVVRYITNKPKLNVTTGSVEASYGLTAGGDPNKSLQAVLNVPILQDTLAGRVVIYDDRRGGYIDNVPSTFTRHNTDIGVHYFGLTNPCPNHQPAGPQGCVPAIDQTANNYALAENNQNPVEYGGIRGELLYQINDNWNVLLSQSYQDMEADGQFNSYPIGSEGQVLGPYQFTGFSPAYDKDHFENTAWTVTGQLGPIKAVYTGSYLVRNIDQADDYTNYARSVGGYYYSCTGGPAGDGALGAGTTAQCYSPVTSWHDTVRNTHQSHELRFSTPDDWRTRGIFGLYWEDFEIADVMNFLYKTIPSCNPLNLANALAGGAPCVANVRTAPGSTATDPGIRNDNTAFGEDAQRGYKQTALFGSIDFDLLPKVLTATFGTRYYHYSDFETGSQYGTNTSCVDVPNGDCSGGMHNINAENLSTTYHGFRSRANLTWHVTSDIMAYYTWSQGFRPGGFNRTQGLEATGPDGVKQYNKPQGYTPDELINNEIGLKSEWLDHRLLVDLSAYHMEWNNVQLQFYNPAVLGNTTFGVNGPDYQVNGLELQAIARITDQFTLQGSSSWNSSKQTNSPCLIANNPGSVTFGKCITEAVQSGVGLVPFQNPFGSVGSRPAMSPAIEFNIRARYDWTMWSVYKAWAWVGANHVGTMSNDPATYLSGDLPSEAVPTTTYLRYTQPGYTTYDASIGIAKDNWTAQFYGQNLSNNDASTFTSSSQFIKAETPLRPRVLGVTIGYKF